jgi:hypothetical protein
VGRKNFTTSVPERAFFRKNGGGDGCGVRRASGNIEKLKKRPQLRPPEEGTFLLQAITFTGKNNVDMLN